MNRDQTTSSSPSGDAPLAGRPVALDQAPSFREQGAGPARRFRPPLSFWLLGSGAALLAGARLIQFWPFGLPLCGLRALTGIPCPLCGSTRCLIAWSHGDVVQALHFNPLVASAIPILLAWQMLAALDYCVGRDWSARLGRRVRRQPWPAILIAAALVNWAYLICFLPKS